MNATVSQSNHLSNARADLIIPDSSDETRRVTITKFRRDIVIHFEILQKLLFCSNFTTTAPESRIY